MRGFLLIAVGVVVIACGFSSADAVAYTAIDTSQFRDGIEHWQKKYGRDRDDAQLDESDIVRIASNILEFQNPDGGWPKNLDYLSDVDPATVRELRGRSLARSTFDNRCTYPQVAYLAKAYLQTQNMKHREAVHRALDYILREQRTSGGWRGSDVDAITFNDDVMVGVMRLLLDIQNRASHFAWLEDDRRQRVGEALGRAVAAVLACQIEVDGRKTAWCQQHAHDTYLPVKARSYELPSITGQESVGVVRFLIELPDPSPEVVVAVDAAVTWFEASKITGMRVDTIEIEPVRFEHHTTRIDKVVVSDPNAPPLWARYYKIETNRPFMANRDGTVVYNLAEVALERRTGYAWYGDWATRLLAEEYPAWRAGLGGE
jgi:PelA/Pel-15E family pectate lyase